MPAGMREREVPPLTRKVESESEGLRRDWDDKDEARTDDVGFDEESSFNQPAYSSRMRRRIFRTILPDENSE
jgi:hypothetical protein